MDKSNMRFDLNITKWCMTWAWQSRVFKTNTSAINMYINCEIILYEHNDNTYIPGDVIRGVVRYVLSEETLFHKISVSLRGFGELYITWKEGSGSDERTITYRDKENYVDIDYVNIDDLEKDNIKKEGPVPAGTHDIPFNFTLPENIPPTFNYKETIMGYRTQCKIFYYLSIKFERPGFSELNKKFREEIIVGNLAKATMPLTPIMLGLKKKPFQPFQGNDKTVNLTCTVENSVTTPGGLVKINYELENATNLQLKGLKIILTQEIIFKRKRYFDITDRKTINSTKVPVKEGDKEIAEFVMKIPPYLITLQNSSQVSRNYFINVIVMFPFPHRDAVLKIPIQIVRYNMSDSNTAHEASVVYDPPPSYSEVMAEYDEDGKLHD